MTVYRVMLFVGSILLCFYFSCAVSTAKGIQLPEDGLFFDQISDYGIFKSNSTKFVQDERLVPYRVINELFTDYAEKDRYLYMPEGKKAVLRADGFFDWPEGAMIVKNFGYSDEQMSKSKVIETRLLIKGLSGWKAISYVWDDAQKNAKISKVGDIQSVEITHRDKRLAFDYIVPNKNQCKSCHNKNDQIDPLGFKYANINMVGEFDGQESSQIDYLAAKSMISTVYGNPDISTMIQYTDTTQDLQNRALAYLDVNCGHCHRPEGPGNTSGLFLQYEERRTNHLGFCKGPVAAGKGSGGRAFDIMPGAADQSIVYFRMLSEDPSTMMPEIGRSIHHAEGVELIKQWINSLEYDCDESMN